MTPAPFDRGRPSGLLRAFLRFPILLYRIGLGRLLGDRFLLLTHTGRKSGRPRRTVIEVLRRDPVTGACSVAAAWGDRSDWVRNLRRDSRARVAIGADSFPAIADFLEKAAAAEELLAYAERHPTAFRALTRTLMGEAAPATCPGIARLAASVPIVMFRPVGEA